MTTIILRATCSLKSIVARIKIRATNKEKIFVILISDKGLVNIWKGCINQFFKKDQKKISLFKKDS